MLAWIRLKPNCEATPEEIQEFCRGQIAYFKVPFYFGGTALLIVVGVQLDTIKQMESHLLMRHYDGFLKKGTIKGRRG